MPLVEPLAVPRLYCGSGARLGLHHPRPAQPTKSLILKKYPEYFQLRFGDISQDPDFLVMFRKELFLQRHEIGYHIGPHTDIPTRVFTCIFSFAERPGFERFGTELLAHKDRMVRCWGNDHYDMSDFVVRKVAEYKPNNFFLFF